MTITIHGLVETVVETEVEVGEVGAGALRISGHNERGKSGGHSGRINDSYPEGGHCSF
jgi:hypothetical protein